MTKIINTKPINDVHSPDFQSKLDECFKPQPKKNKTKRPSAQARYWAQGIMGIRSPVTKDESET